MKARIFYLFAFLSVALFIFNSNSSGAGAAQTADRTGSPVGNGSCATCHSGGNFGTNVSVALLKDGEAVSQYSPGETYTYRVTINASNNPSAFGFQTVALVDSDNSNAGQFGTAPNNTQITTLENRQYFEHATRLNNGTIEIEWTAPDAGAGDVKFYAVANAVDNNSSTSGDSPAMLEMPLTVNEAVVSGIFDVDRLAVDLELYPNPTSEWLNLQVSNAPILGRYQMQIIDLSGKIVLEQSLDIVEAQYIKGFSVSTLQPGQYFLRLTDGNAVASKAFLKR